MTELKQASSLSALKTVDWFDCENFADFQDYCTLDNRVLIFFKASFVYQRAITWYKDDFLTWRTSLKFVLKVLAFSSVILLLLLYPSFANNDNEDPENPVTIVQALLLLICILTLNWDIGTMTQKSLTGLFGVRNQQVEESVTPDKYFLICLCVAFGIPGLATNGHEHKNILRNILTRIRFVRFITTSFFPVAFNYIAYLGSWLFLFIGLCASWSAVLELNFDLWMARIDKEPNTHPFGWMNRIWPSWLNFFWVSLKVVAIVLCSLYRSGRVLPEDYTEEIAPEVPALVLICVLLVSNMEPDWFRMQILTSQYDEQEQKCYPYVLFVALIFRALFGISSIAHAFIRNRTLLVLNVYLSLLASILHSVLLWMLIFAQNRRYFMEKHGDRKNTVEMGKQFAPVEKAA